MQRTTVYVPADLKQVLARTAAARGVSPAEVIREARRALAQAATPPQPRVALFRSGKPRLAECVDDALAGCGDP